MLLGLVYFDPINIRSGGVALMIQLFTNTGRLQEFCCQTIHTHLHTCCGCSSTLCISRMMQVMVAHGADWSSISPQLLSSIFEMQSNALDKCAAACTCVQWRHAVSESHIAYLHLHADSPSYNSNWRSFFRGRRSIASLKLTSDIRQRCKTWAPLLAKSVEQGCCLKQIPLGCSALSVSHDFLGVPGCISHLVVLQHVKFTCNPQTFDLTFDPSMLQYEDGPLPDLSFLNHLQKLELHQEDGGVTCSSNDFSMPSKVLLVEHLVLTHVSSYLYILDKLFTALTQLELVKCDVYEPDQLVVGSLRSLNLEGSTLEDDGGCIPDWTQLTSLRLTDSYWIGEGNSPPALKVFNGWPSLKVLHCSGCNLFDSKTDLQLWPAMQLQLDWVMPDTDCAELSVVNTQSHPDVIGCCIRNALCASCLARLQVHFRLDNLPSDGFASLSSDICSWLEACPHLQVLSLSAPSLSASYPVPATFAPSNAHITCLREVQLHYLPFGVIDLEKALHLSVLKLTVDCSNVLCRLCLPSSLQHFEFEGSFLFAGHGRSALSDCSLMTKLALNPDQTGCTEYGMPELPRSLAHLTLDWKMLSLTTLMGRRALTGLQACTNLERLTIPRQYCQCALLEKFANAARHLHVFEYC